MFSLFFLGISFEWCLGAPHFLPIKSSQFLDISCWCRWARLGTFQRMWSSLLNARVTLEALVSRSHTKRFNNPLREKNWFLLWLHQQTFFFREYIYIYVYHSLYIKFKVNDSAGTEATDVGIVHFGKFFIFNFDCYEHEFCWDGWTGGLWYLCGETRDIAEVPFGGTERAVQDVKAGTRSFLHKSSMSKIGIFEHSIAFDIMCTLLDRNSSLFTDIFYLRIQELGLRVAVRDFEREVWQRSLDNSPRAQQIILMRLMREMGNSHLDFDFFSHSFRVLLISINTNSYTDFQQCDDKLQLWKSISLRKPRPFSGVCHVYYILNRSSSKLRSLPF